MPVRLAAALALCLAGCAAAPHAQAPAAAMGSAADPSSPFTTDEHVQGYALRGETTVFVFDAARYGFADDGPARVVVTGGFRTWSTNMDDPAWRLENDGTGLWTLAVPNAGVAAVPPATPFKFRVDDAAGPGRWLDPLPGAPNAVGGNLVFLFGVEPPRLRAELRGPRAVWARVSGDDPASSAGQALARPLGREAYRLTLADGTPIPIAAVLPNEAETALVVPAQDLDTRRVHYLHVQAGGGELRAMASFDGVWRTMCSDKPLGANVVGPRTEIRLFAPRADSVRVHFYASETGPQAESHALRPVGQGVWEVTVAGDRHGTYYDVSVFGPDDPGNTFTNHTGRRVRDPYARVVASEFGRARIWRATEPARPLADGRPRLEDLVAYEVHLQDFTDNLPVADDLRGTIPAMATPGLRNAAGEPVGIDHLVRLGINAVHLLPMQEFFHYPDDVWQAAFADDPFMQAQGIARENYQWGYRITDFFAVEGRYRRRGTEPGAEREQFRDLVQAFHDRGIAVLVDYVFNHTGENMEGLDHILTFNGIDRHYAYRLDQDGRNIGPYGNEVKSENRPMMQRWLLDQMQHFIDEFGIDGFRIDLAGATDEQTLRMIRAALPQDVIVYGEPWIPPSDPDVIANPSWAWYKADAPIVYFQDDSRNAFKGPTSTPRNPATDRGFAGGDGTQRPTVMQALTATLPDEHGPLAGISYLDIHDNWALADQFARFTDGPNAWDGRAGVDEAAVRIAAALLFTTPGPLVLHGGTEILRSKGAAPHPDELGGERIVRTSMGPIYLKGRGDTYNLRHANRFDWDTVGRRAGPVDYAASLDWWRGLIALRAGPHGAAFRRADRPVEGRDLTFLMPADGHAEGLGLVVRGREGGADLLVLFNPSLSAEATFAAPAGAWTALAESDRDGGRVEPERGLGARTGGTVRLGPQAVRIWRR